MAYAGDTLQFETHIADIYDKKGGALSFVVREIARDQPAAASTWPTCAACWCIATAEREETRP